jgi:predicted TIM-barrel fold metal-dependent hydrolase
VHCHFFPPDLRDAIAAAGIDAAGGVHIPPWTPELAIDFMDRHGIATQVVSASDPAVTFADRPEALALARSANLYARELIDTYPGRFGALAVLPLPDVVSAVEEIAYALDVLKLDGVGMLSSYSIDGVRVYPGDPELDPVLAGLDSRGTYVMIHPTAPPADDRPEMHGVPAAALEFTFDTTRAASNLIWTGALERFPDIRWSLSHAGGTLPFVGYRTANFPTMLKGEPVAGNDVSRPLLARFLYDTALNPTRPAMGAIREITGVDGILFGSDFPFTQTLYPAIGDCQPELGDTFDDDELRALGRTNALRQFPRLASRVNSAG